VSAFEDLFNYASPKFISPCAPNFDVITDTNMEAPKLQSRLFMAEVKQQLLLPEIRSYLKLYTTIEIRKLALLMDVEPSTFRSYLHGLKHKSFAISGSFDDPPLGGQYATSSDIAFHVERDVVHISDSKPASRHGEYFISQIAKLDALLKRRGYAEKSSHGDHGSRGSSRKH
jgi:translation initiation factor 3 subunit L